MRNEPTDIAKQDLRATLSVHWHIDAHTLEYAPVGFGSYHWLATDRTGARWFLTADRLSMLGPHEGGVEDAFAALDAAFATSAALANARLSFVLAPRLTVTGKVLLRVSHEWSLAVFPYVTPASAAGPGEWAGTQTRPRAASLIGRLHAAAPPGSLRRWTPAIPHRAAMQAVLDDLETRWGSGPYAEPARHLLRESRSSILAAFRRYDGSAQAAGISTSEWVVTHGEPHSANFLVLPDGDLLLIDWDTVLLAPPERDLWIVVGDDPAAFSAYQRESHDRTPDLRTMDLFRVRWQLADLAVYARTFHGPHGDSFDEQLSWRELQECVRFVVGWVSRTS